MKSIMDENKKVCLTIGQLRKLVRESVDGLDDKEVAIKNLRDYAANKIISGRSEQEWEFPGGVKGAMEADMILRKSGYSKICVLGDRINFKHGSPMEDTLVKNRSGRYAVANLEQEWGKLKMRLRIVDVEPIREYAEILDDDSLDEPLEVKEDSSCSTVYVSFPSVPPKAARDKLRMNGFKWDGKRWQAPCGDNAMEVAKSMKKFNGVVDVDDPEVWDLDYMLGY